MRLTLLEAPLLRTSRILLPGHTRLDSITPARGCNRARLFRQSRLEVMDAQDEINLLCQYIEADDTVQVARLLQSDLLRQEKSPLCRESEPHHPDSRRRTWN